MRIELAQIMENTGRSLAELAIRRFTPATVSLLAGPGGNGGGQAPPGTWPTGAWT